MTGVAIIHAADDAAPAHALAAKLRAMGYEVATDLQPGVQIRGALMDADAVVALWSPRAIGHAALVAEAGFARGMGRLIHARMHNTPVPPEFSRDPSIDLTGWRGEDTFAGWLNLRAAVEGVIAAVYGEEVGEIDFGEPAEPRKLSEREHRERELAMREQERRERDFERSAREQPYAAYRDTASYRDAAFRGPPRTHREGASPLRLALIGLVTFLIVAGVGIGAYSMFIGGRSAADAQAAWASLDKTNPLAIRAFLDGSPGEFRQPAQTALDELEVAALARARETQTIDAYQRFLNNFPGTAHRAEILGSMAMLRQRERDQAVLPLEPTPEETTTDPQAAGGVPEDLTTPPDAAEDLSDRPVQLSPRAEDSPPDREEQLRREISGEDRSMDEFQ